MEESTGLLQIFGVSTEQFLYVSGFVYFLVEAVKTKVASRVGLAGGWTTDILALVIAGGISAKLYAPNWEAVAALTLGCWLIPAGVHKARKMNK